MGVSRENREINYCEAYHQVSLCLGKLWAKATVPNVKEVESNR